MLLVLFFLVSRVSFTQAMYNGEEGSVVEVCAEISNPVAMEASIALTVSNAVAGYDNAEGNVLIPSVGRGLIVVGLCVCVCVTM